MKKLLSFLAVAICCARVQAQNIEGQIIASQFGAYQVHGTATGSLQFEPASCQVTGGGKNFAAFTTGVPLKIVDSSPALDEVATPSSVNITACTVSMATTYIHATPFYVTSGTGGLQEALINGRTKQGGPNTVILDADWYTQVAPSNPVTVIAAVHGSTSLGLVDVTTVPYTVYQWTGSAYTVVPYSSGNLPGGTGVVKVNGGTGALATPGTDYVIPSGSITGNAGTASNLLGTPALPNGVTATTGTVGENDNRLATNAQVFASRNGSIPNTNAVLKGNSVLGQAIAATPGTDYLAPGLLPSNTTATTPTTGDSSTKVATTAFVQSNAAPGVTPATFGAVGDAQLIPNGCNTTASSTTVVCPGASFVSGDAGVGKEIWIGGAGIAGGALGSVIATVVNGTTITISPSAATATVTNAYSVYGHDDILAIQACWNYSAANRVQCVMNSPSGYLEANANGGNGLQMAVTPVTYNGAMNVQGVSQTKGTNIFCEINGDCISLQAGPVQGATMANISLEVDPTQPSGRGFHLNATPAPGSSANSGGLFNSTLTNIQVDLPAQECLWMDAGGGPGYAFNLPNQYVTFNNFTCNGPNQMHTANLVKMTGQEAQITFVNGAINGDDTASLSNYPNPLVAVTEKTGGMNDAPMAVQFWGGTIEVGMKGLYISQSDTIHFDNGYLERLSTAYIVQNSRGITLNGNHVANSGTITAVGDFEIQGTLEMRYNSTINDGGHVPTALAFCNNNSNNIDFTGTIGDAKGTTNCATAQIAPTTSTLTVAGGNTEFVNGSATTITTIAAPGVTPGKTLTLYAASSPGITLGTGGNINLGGFTGPLLIPSGGNVTLQLFDLGPAWLVTATTAGTSVSARKGTFVCTAGGTITIANALELATSDVAISLNAQSGTISTAPAMKTVTGGTGFTVLCGAADTSTYNYDILN